MICLLDPDTGHGRSAVQCTNGCRLERQGIFARDMWNGSDARALRRDQRKTGVEYIYIHNAHIRFAHLKGVTER